MSGEVTLLLRAISKGDESAVSQLFAVVYDELHSRARAQLAGSLPQTLGATALVHEAYLKLTAGDSPQWNDRLHFCRVAAKAMRHIALDYARARKAGRRGGDARKVDIDVACFAIDDSAQSLVALDAALEALAGKSKRLAQLVELRFFAGLSVDDAATALSVSARTIKRDWRVARAFIYTRMSDHIHST